MRFKEKVYVAIIVIAVVAIILAVVFSLGRKTIQENALNESIPILLYAKGLPYTLSNLSFSSQHIRIVGTQGSANFSYGYFMPGSLVNSAMYAGSFKRNWTNVTISYSLISPRFYFDGINNSFGNGSIDMRMPVTNFDTSNALILGIRFFPLEYYASYPSVALESALYPILYAGSNSNIGAYIENKSTPGILQYNITGKAPVSFSIYNSTRGYMLNVNVSNRGNDTLDLEDIELGGYFLGSQSSNFSLPRVTVVNESDPYIIAEIDNLGINISSNSSLSFLQTNISSVNRLFGKIRAGAITNAGQFYSYFNSTLNVSRLEYLESLMMENSSYYIAMHALKNYDPTNGSVAEYASRISSWNNAYLGFITLNVSNSGSLHLPKSKNAINATGYAIKPGQSASFLFALGNLSYEGQSTSPINGINYTAFAYFNGVQYSDAVNSYR
ncbi:MAG: hypothetical protein M1465_02660 [Candidatus Marsarchaeota archaeon]|jgi:hypothetical protein|nr:hypothetical protein [Candidatus Marsarchaeota archaeon]